MERAMGIEPTSEAWEASILPLYDARSMSIILAAINGGDNRAIERKLSLRLGRSVEPLGKFVFRMSWVGGAVCVVLMNAGSSLKKSESWKYKRTCIVRQAASS
jgi:hypothetical protein